MSDEIDALAAEQRQRLDDAQAAERDLLDVLDAHGQAHVWERVRDKLHCEAFVDSRTGKRMIDVLVRTIVGAQEQWLLDPRFDSPECREAHSRARAAHFAIGAMNEILQDGGDAERELSQLQRELGE